MTSSGVNIFRVTGSLCRESTGHRWIPLAKANAEQTVKQTDDHRWFKMPSRPLWQHFNDINNFVVIRDTGGCRCNIGFEHKSEVRQIKSG